MGVPVMNAGETVESCGVAQRNLPLASCETLVEPRLLLVLDLQGQGRVELSDKETHPITSPSGS